MNQIFNLKRFYKFLKTETLVNKNVIVLALLILILGFITIYYINNFILNNLFMSAGIEGNEMTTDTNIIPNNIGVSYLFMLQIIVVVLPFMLYKSLYDKVKSVKYFILPASQLEKVSAAIMQTSIIIPILLTIALAIITLIIYLITPTQITITFSDYFDSIYDAIRLQSLIFLGVFWFKNNKFIKIIIAIILLFILFFIITINYEPNFVLNFITDNISIILAVLFPFIPWLISYIRYTKTQV
ncbi:MAG: hypothetical protein FWG85_04180 [Bacteroidetes bacterium]|nr:hypothetical protein [Bacteroidota bacterium]